LALKDVNALPKATDVRCSAVASNPICASQPSSAPPKPATKGQLAALGSLLLLLIFFGVPALMFFFESPEQRVKDAKIEAYSAAKRFVVDAYPGVKSISSFGDSIVTQDGVTFKIGLTVDGVNGFNAPIRKTVGVTVQRTGDTFRLIEMRQD
jgi:hypothetical protein